MPRTTKPSVTGPPESLASCAQVAEFLGVPQQTLANWRARSVGPKYLKVGRYVRYRWSDISAWLDTL